MHNIPVQGKNYTVQDGDCLSFIASIAYGDGTQWGLIAAANGIPRTEAADLIYPGQVFFIPPKEEKARAENEAKKNRFSQNPKNKVTVVLDGRELPVKQGKFGCGIDVLASSYNAEIAWNPGKDKWLDGITARGSYAPSELYLGSKLVCTARLYARENKITASGITKVLEFYSKTADIVDSCIPPSAGELGGNLQQIAKKLLDMHGFPVTFIDPPGDAVEGPERGGVETVAKYLQRLAAQKGLFLSCDESGGAVFQKLVSSGEPVANIEHGSRSGLEYKARFDDRLRFNKYFASSIPGDGEPLNATAVDPEVPAARQILFEANDADSGNIQQAANWKMIRLELEAMAVDIPVAGWYDGSGGLWKPNTIVTVRAPVLDIPDEKNYAVKQAEFAWSADKRSAVLQLVPLLGADQLGNLRGAAAAKKTPPPPAEITQRITDQRRFNRTEFAALQEELQRRK